LREPGVLSRRIDTPASLRGTPGLTYPEIEAVAYWPTALSRPRALPKSAPPPAENALK
jgi:hypothetical protein